ncbi:MAG: metalloregulator ArsR/SmtB family transcription factor [Verrucomicrobiota bacterium]
MKENDCIPALKALAEETRWKIVAALLKRPQTIAELVDGLGVSQYNISKHVRILREAGVVETRREGKFVRCRITESYQRRYQEGGKEKLDLGCCEFEFAEEEPCAE